MKIPETQDATNAIELMIAFVEELSGKDKQNILTSEKEKCEAAITSLKKVVCLFITYFV